MIEKSMKTLKKTIKKLFRTNRRILVEKDLKKINLKKYKRVLVVGSGKDPYRNLFSEDVEEYVRFDIEPHDGLTDVIGDIHEAPFDDNSFDCIFAIEVMEHLENPFLFKKEIKRMLKKGGSMVLTVPFIFHMHADPFDYWRPTKMALSELFDDFDELSISNQGNRLHVILDLISTSFRNNNLFKILRVFNLPLSLIDFKSDSTACSGFFVTAKK
ncbi:MAG: hypothetical protein CMG09_00375 [Candidatus Marinimicrobia bacterium]|nr:hypothetical protein [Candidatus Neomarinimicrobiota bacterium]